MCPAEQPFFTQADSDVLCLGLPLSECGDKLKEDARFLRLIVEMLSQKLSLAAQIGANTAPLPERVINYLQIKCGHQTLRGVEHTAQQLNYSSCQLQRVLNRLEAQGAVKKIGKGTYRLNKVGSD